ncbi:unnamed protein product [Brassica oleracea var. botrytis]
MKMSRLSDAITGGRQAAAVLPTWVGGSARTNDDRGDIISPCVYGKEFSDHQEIEVEKLLKLLNKPARKSIKSEDGDIIDCVPIHSQPAFDHPLLKNHTIQMRPSFIPEISVPEDNLSNNHEYAIMNSRRGKYFGTKFLVNVWKPEEVRSNEFSLAQTWLASGHGANINTIEAGLQVYPDIYGDNNTRLFVFWTVTDAYKNGCYNTKCPGFVQKSSLITVGGAYNTVSQYDGVQYELSVLIWKSGENWWLRVGEELVGYWPGALFTSLGDGATRVQWGGEIVNVKTGGKHTITDMGSGHFADEGVKKASYFRNIMTVDGTNTLTEKGIFPKTTNDNCYNIKAGDGGTAWGLNFFFGGPGQNERCP